MARIRLFVETDLAEGREIALPEHQAHYLGTVMRLSAGAELLVFNGRDGEWRARLDAIGRRAARLSPLEHSRPQPESTGPELLIAALKRDPMDFIARAATEMGVVAIRPVFTARTNAARVGTDRLAVIAIEAAEQCGRLDVPRIEAPAPLATVLDAWPAERPLVVADESLAAPSPAFLASPSPAERGGAGEGVVPHDWRRACGAAPSPALPRCAGEKEARKGGVGVPALLIGPEGGFTPGELDALRVRAFVTAVGLGPRILRAETAAIAALALLQAFCGDWRSP